MTSALNKINSSQFEKFEQTIGIRFKNKNLLKEALIHSSYAKINKLSVYNERLEFFGDAVLKLVISEYLFKRYPDYKEGKLTKIRAQLVADKFLKQFSEDINLGDFLLMSQAELRSGGKTRSSNLANGFEALLGAIYLDSGLKPAQTFLLEILEKHNINYNQIENVDYKSRLQELLQKAQLDLPKYEVVSEEGPEHQKVFEIKLAINYKNKNYEVKGKGISKKEAHQNAAKKMLSKLR